MKTIKITHKSATPRLIGATGELSTSFDFNYQEVYESCGVMHENNYFVYGGSQNRRQVLQLVNCGLTSIDSLLFDLYASACDASNGLIVLCFDFNDNKQCRRATSPLGPWDMMTPSTFSHARTSIAISPGN